MADIRDRYILEVDTQGGVRNMNSAGTAVAGLGASMARLGPIAVAAAGALAGLGAIRGISNTIDGMDELAKSARLAGAAAGEDAFRGFQVLQQAMAEAGIDAATFDRAMLQTTSRLQEGLEGGEAFAEIVGKLGDSIVDENGNLLDGATALQAMINALNEGTISTDEFARVVGGRAGPLIQQQFASLNTSAEDLAATLADVEANSNIVSLDAANNAEVFNDTLGRLGEVAGQLGTDIATALLPILVNLAEGALAILPDLVEGVKAAFEAFRPVIEALMPVGQALFDLLQALWPVFETLLGAIAPVVEVLAQGLTSAINAVITVIETVVEAITGFIEKIREVAGAVREVASSVGDRWNSMTEGMADGARNAANRVTGFFGDMYDEVVGNSIIPDMADGVLSTFDDMTGGMVSRISDAVSRVSRAFGDVARAVGGEFERITGISLSNVRSQADRLGGEVFSTIQNLSSQISSRFSGVIDSARGIANNIGAGGLFSGVSDLFAGFFANGGRIPRGQFGIVGERGPELVTGPAQITPFDQLGGQQQVVYNINAVDARSFRDLLATDPAYIHALAQRGQRTVPGRF